jgi:hypothetical protein
MADGADSSSGADGADDASGAGGADGGRSEESGQDAAELRALLDLLESPQHLPPPDRTLRYGAHPAQVVDCYGPHPPRLAVLHGGFWRQAYDRTHLVPFAAALAGQVQRLAEAARQEIRPVSELRNGFADALFRHRVNVDGLIDHP